MKKVWALLFTILMVLSLSLAVGCQTTDEAPTPGYGEPAAGYGEPAAPGY